LDRKKKMTRTMICDSLKGLMHKHPFEKITIKMITGQAGLIRPTFYKHFQDKYEVLEWIFKTRVTDSVDLMLENGMELEAIVMFCRCLDKDRKFLTAGGVFDDDQIDAFIELKMAEVMRFEMTPHPVEYDMYYSA
jgi:AcrR family transcriptional regulator